MREPRRSARLPAAIALSLLVSAATGQHVQYRAPSAALAQLHGTAPARDLAASKQMRAERGAPNARREPDATAAAFSVSAPATIPPASTAQPPAAATSLEYSAVGYIEEGGVRKAVLASGGRIVLKEVGDEVEAGFRLVVVDPPALLHLSTGTVVRVPRQTHAPSAPMAAVGRDPDRAVEGIPERVAPIDTTNAAEFEEALARALAAR